MARGGKRKGAGRKPKLLRMKPGRPPNPRLLSEKKTSDNPVTEAYYRIDAALPEITSRLIDIALHGKNNEALRASSELLNKRIASVNRNENVTDNTITIEFVEEDEDADA